ncbi:MAG TPA: efflux transporter outer membrane subunit [Caulobacteraceae bacterium]|nr:efflux transporter outer membrane subunit [Caulobacteraceae bacterium]
MSFRSVSRRLPATALCAALVLGVAGLDACAPDLGPAPKIRSAEDYAAAKTFSRAVTEWPAEDWWAAYNDPQLSSLIERALKGSPDLKMVQARLDQAQAQAQQAGAGLLPSLSAKGSIEETGVKLNFPGTPAQFHQFLPSSAQPFTQLSANLSYQLDFFGRNRAAVSAASSSARAAQFELAAARLQLSTAVATAYANLILAEANKAAAQDAARLRNNSSALVADRLKNGLETRAEYSQSSAADQASQVDLIATTGAVLEARYALAALLGEGPDAVLDLQPAAGLKTTPVGLPANLAANLIGRRPDVAAARLRVEAAAQREKVARADFYPNVNLVGSAMVLSMTPKDIFTHNLELLQAGPAVSLPIFEGGRLTGAARNARGEYEAAVANYDKTLIQALHEVADAITVRQGAQESIDHAERAMAASEDAYKLVNLRYKAGLTPYLAVISVESARVASRRQLDGLRAQALGADVALIRALGGGFDAPSAAPKSNP